MTSRRLRILDLPSAEEAEKRPRFTLPPVLSSHPCGACAASCCAAGATVELTTVEALRLARAALLTLEHVVERVDCPPDRADRQASVPIPLDDGLTVLRLRHVDGACTFLHRHRDQGRCSVHADRPALCRFYPFKLQVGDEVLEVGDQHLCPVGWLRTDTLEASLRADHRAWRKDLALERRLVAAWRHAGGAEKGWREYAVYAAWWVGAELGWDWPRVLARPGRPLR